MAFTGTKEVATVIGPDFIAMKLGLQEAKKLVNKHKTRQSSVKIWTWDDSRVQRLNLLPPLLFPLVPALG